MLFRSKTEESARLKKYIEDLDKEKLNKTLKELKEVNIDSFEEGYVTRIRGFIPFFKIEYELKLEKDLMEIGIPAGKQLGIILNELLDCVLEDPQMNNKESLIKIAESLKSNSSVQSS